jgi:hypothetical protein
MTLPHSSKSKLNGNDKLLSHNVHGVYLVDKSVGIMP